jgi:hypothetical protein
MGVQLGDLLLGDLHLLECGGDLLEGQIPPLASQGDQPPKLLDVGDRALSRIALNDVRRRL